MKYSCLAVLAVVLLAASAHAQAPDPGRPFPPPDTPVKLKMRIGLPLGHLLHRHRRYPVYILQDGDPSEAVYHATLKALMAWQIANLSGEEPAVVVYPQLRREYWAKHNKRTMCELDWFHRLDDLDAVIDQVKKLPYVDPSRIFLVGHSSGAEIVTKTCARRGDIAGVALISGLLEPYCDWVKFSGEEAWMERMLRRDCSKDDHYNDRNARFWEQNCHSGQDQAILECKAPMISISGLNDGIYRRLSLRQSQLCPVIQSERAGFECVALSGSHTGVYLSYESWHRIRHRFAKVSLRSAGN